jgi:hypothetical protein
MKILFVLVIWTFGPASDIDPTRIGVYEKKSQCEQWGKWYEANHFRVQSFDCVPSNG